VIARAALKSRLLRQQ